MAEVSMDLFKPIKRQNASGRANGKRNILKYQMGEMASRGRAVRYKLDQEDERIKHGARNKHMCWLLAEIRRIIKEFGLGSKRAKTIIRNNIVQARQLAKEYADIARAVKKWENTKPKTRPILPDGWYKQVGSFGGSRRHYLKSGQPVCKRGPYNGLNKKHESELTWVPSGFTKNRCLYCQATVEKRPLGKYKYPHECLKCGYTWHGMVEHPVICPKCTTKTWNYPRSDCNRNGDPKKFPWHHTCQKCSHKWHSKHERPQHCSSCGHLHYTTRPR